MSFQFKRCRAAEAKDSAFAENVRNNLGSDNVTGSPVVLFTLNMAAA